MSGVQQRMVITDGGRSKMKLTCLVDDAVQDHRFWGEHGLSFLIETEAGRVLLDTGQSGTVLLHNAKIAGIDLASISCVVLSHAHYDHTGGLAALLREAGRLRVFGHPDVFRQRFSRHGEQIESVGLRFSREQLLRRAELSLSREPVEVLPGVFTTGEIGFRPGPEGRSEHHWVRDGSGWAADPYLDDMSLLLKVDAGWVLICGCCHAGLVNTLRHVEARFGGPIVAIIGGTHLAHLNEAHMRQVIQELQKLGPPRLFPNHCTGQSKYVALAVAFGDRVAPCAAGTVLTW